MARDTHFLVPATVLATMPALGITLGVGDTCSFVYPEADEQEQFPIKLLVVSTTVKPVGYSVETRTYYKIRLRAIADFLETKGENLPGAKQLRFVLEDNKTKLRIYSE